MKKIFHINILILSFLFSFSCSKKEKTKADLIQEFVSENRSGKTKIQDSSFSLIKTEKTAANEISLTFQSTFSADDLQPSLVKSAVTDLMVKIIKINPKNMILLDKGVNFKLKLIGKDHKIITEEIINKSNISATKPDYNFNEKHNQLNQMLEMSNSNLPIIDSATGVKIVKVALGSNDDVIYTAEVPEKIKNLVKTTENKAIIRQNMSKDQQFGKMVSELKKYDIHSVKYQYRDKNGKLLQEVEMTEKDFK